MTAGGPSRAALRRIVRAVVAAEVGRVRGPGGLPLPIGEWSDDLPLGDAGLGLDSLDRMGALAALGETFDLGADRGADRVDGWTPKRVGDWLDAVAEAGPQRVVLMTSGSTGTPRPCAHAMSDLMAEAAWIARAVGARGRVVALVPSHHIYGLIWTALLPDLLGAPVLDAATGPALRLAPGDLVVAVPEQWRTLLRLQGRFPEGVTGVSAAGRLDDDLGRDLLDRGLDRLLDMYGASETGGIALREVPAQGYRLLPRWRLGEDGDGVVLIDADGRTIALPDEVDRLDADLIAPRARRDGAVQVAGVNVWPDQVGRVLGGCGGVAEVAVRLGANGRLKAFVVPDGASEAESLVERIDQHARRHLSDVERPASYRLGPSLPRNDMGKLADWA